jgi:hypothetical protein
MPTVIFSTTNSGIDANKNAMIGKWENPLRMIIQNESDICAKNDDIVKALFCVSTSKHFGESFVAQDEFDIFAPTAEGGEAPQDAYREVASKFLKHTTFKKQFRITQEMMEDSLTSQVDLKARKFVRSYYRTRNLFATKILTGATGTTVTFGPTGNTTTFDTTTADGKALYSKSHTDGSNRFHYVMSGTAVEVALLEQVISAAIDKVRNMKDENGISMGYTANQIMIPSNDPKLEAAVKKVLGSEFGCGDGGLLSGSINLHYGNWELIVNPLWQRTNTASHPMIISSTTARDNLAGGVFLNRKPLTMSAHVDQNTDDYIWNGVSRFTAGFVTHKWTTLFDLVDNGATTGFDNGTLSSVSTALTL